MTTPPLGLLSPRISPLHRVRPEVKLLALATIGLLTAITRNPWTTSGALALAVTAHLVARLPARQTLKQLRPVLVLALALVTFHAFTTSIQTGFVLAGGLVALVVLAGVLTATTPSQTLLAALTQAVERLNKTVPPLSPVLSPAAIGLAITLMLRTIPNLREIHANTRDAARARGLDRSPRAVLIPFALRTVAHAQLTGQAIHARGLLDE